MSDDTDYKSRWEEATRKITEQAEQIKTLTTQVEESASRSFPAPGTAEFAEWVGYDMDKATEHLLKHGNLPPKVLEQIVEKTGVPKEAVEAFAGLQVQSHELHSTKSSMVDKAFAEAAGLEFNEDGQPIIPDGLSDAELNMIDTQLASLRDNYSVDGAKTLGETMLKLTGGVKAPAEPAAAPAAEPKPTMDAGDSGGATRARYDFKTSREAWDAAQRASTVEEKNDIIAHAQSMVGDSTTVETA